MDAMVRQGISSLTRALLICAFREQKSLCGTLCGVEREDCKCQAVTRHTTFLQSSTRAGSLLFNLQWSVWGEALPCMADVYMGSCCQRCNRAYAQYKWSHIFWNQVVPKITHLTSAEWHGINGYAARRAQRDKYTSNTALLKNTLLWVRSLISTNIYFKTSTSSALICYKTFS